MTLPFRHKYNRKGMILMFGSDRRKMEFSKLLAIWAAVIATAAVIVSVVLAFLGKQPVTDLSITVFTACTGYLITYAGKSAFEKNSRNKYKVDEDGNPLQPDDDEPGGDPSETVSPPREF